MHIAIDQMDIKTNKDEPFMLHNDHEAGTVIFSCTRNLMYLCNEASEIFIDGATDLMMYPLVPCWYAVKYG